jgi:TetR/AcrR family transcriptional regulator
MDRRNVATVISESALDGHDARSKVLDSALNLFSEKGYDATSIREIIEGAGVTRPVLYYYFKSKEALFCDLIENQFCQVCSELDQILRVHATTPERLRAVALVSFERAKRSPRMVRLLLQFFFSPPIQGLSLDKHKLGFERFSRIVEIIRQGLERGELRGPDPESLAFAFSGMVDLYVMATYEQADAELTREMADRLVSLFLEGAGTGTHCPGNPSALERV